MKSIKKTREQYKFFRNFFDESYSDIEVLEFICLLNDLIINLKKPKKVKKTYTSCSDNRNARFFDDKNLTEAMSDGGWRILNKEKIYSNSLFNDDIDLNMNRTVINQWFMEHAL